MLNLAFQAIEVTAHGRKWLALQEVVGLSSGKTPVVGFLAIEPGAQAPTSVQLIWMSTEEWEIQEKAIRDTALAALAARLKPKENNDGTT